MKHDFQGYDFPDDRLHATWFDVVVFLAVLSAHIALLGYMLLAN